MVSDAGGGTSGTDGAAQLGRRDRRRLAAARRDARPGDRGHRPGLRRHLHGRRSSRSARLATRRPGARESGRRGGRGGDTPPRSQPSGLARPRRALVAEHPALVAQGQRRARVADVPLTGGPPVPRLARVAVGDHRAATGTRPQPRGADDDHGLVEAQLRVRRRSLRGDARRPDRPRARQRGPVLRPGEHRAPHGHGDVDPRRGDRDPRLRRRAGLRQPGGGQVARLRDRRGGDLDADREDPRPLRDSRRGGQRGRGRGPGRAPGAHRAADRGSDAPA